jgi:hypothetical protein
LRSIDGWRAFENAYWMDWQESLMWQGIPVVEVSGPGGARQPLLVAWMKHAAGGRAAGSGGIDATRALRGTGTVGRQTRVTP